MQLLITISAFLVALGVLITIHELGHYGVARICGVKVLRFSVGFGHTLVKWQSGSGPTTWTICAIPLGGYVKMLDEREGPVHPDEIGQTFNRQPVFKRFMIVLAGPAANLALATFLYWALLVGGVREARPVLGAPAHGTPAAMANVAERDVIQKVGEQAVRSWQEARWLILQSLANAQRVRIQVIDYEGRNATRELDPRKLDIGEPGDDPITRTGLVLYRPKVLPVIGSLVDGEPALLAGLRPGDLIERVDGQPVESWEDLARLVRENPGRPLTLQLTRAAVKLEISVTPKAYQSQSGESPVGRIGAAPRIPQEDLAALTSLVQYGPLEALGKAWTRSWETAEFTLRMIGRMVIGEVSLKNVSGPITIAEYAGQSAQLGIAPYLSFLALISISLFVLNLLPVPVLDGGHLLYYMIELLKGSPLSERAMEFGQHVGITLIMVLMAFALFNDVTRVLS